MYGVRSSKNGFYAKTIRHTVPHMDRTEKTSLRKYKGPMAVLRKSYQVVLGVYTGDPEFRYSVIFWILDSGFHRIADRKTWLKLQAFNAKSDFRNEMKTAIFHKMMKF